jgi:hypothetical protein
VEQLLFGECLIAHNFLSSQFPQSLPHNLQIPPNVVVLSIQKIQPLDGRLVELAAGQGVEGGEYAGADFRQLVTGDECLVIGVADP